MADCRIFFVFVLTLIINNAQCSFRHAIHKRVEEINNISRVMYGEIAEDDFRRNYNVEDSLMYPRGNRRKLSAISQIWREYYSCSAHLLDRLSVARALPSSIIVVYVGAVARLPCGVCLAPGEKRRPRRWMVAKTPGTLKFTNVEEHERMVVKGGNMTIYNVMPEDGGVFQCEVGGSNSSLVILEVVDQEEPYRVVKGPESRGPHASPPESYRGVISFSVWAPWSECSTCGKVGRRHRHGMCYVKLDPKLMANETKKDNETEDFVELDHNDIGLFKVFSDGIPCRSQYLPPPIKLLNQGQQRPSEIMISMCKVSCEDQAPSHSAEASSADKTHGKGAVLLFSLNEDLPKQPPLAARDTIYADFGRPITLRCPGTTLRDVPVSWRAGSRRVQPRQVLRASAGRVHVNSRDYLVFSNVLYTDANLYSCWQGENLAGSVKLIVWAGPHARWSHHVTLAALVLAAALLLKCAEQALSHVQRRHNVMFYMHM